MKTVEFLATGEFGTGDDIASHHEYVLGRNSQLLRHSRGISLVSLYEAYGLSRVARRVLTLRQPLASREVRWFANLDPRILLRSYYCGEYAAPEVTQMQSDGNAKKDCRNSSPHH